MKVSVNMNERITLVALFNKNNLEKINSIIKTINESLCKVPFGKNVDDRIKVDTLPSHFTLSAWDIDQENFILQKLSNLNFNKFKVIVDSIEIMSGKENSYVLYFNIKANNELESLQKRIYNILPSKKYNHNKFQFHITITIDKDYEKIIRIKNKLEEIFIPFDLEIDSIGLFEIYPANLIKTVNCIRIEDSKK